MRYLLVIDMQEQYLGKDRNRKIHPYNEDKLINKINERIREYPRDNVVYITHRFFWEFNKKTKKLVSGLLIVSENIFEKKKASSFTNEKLCEFLIERNVTELELVGIDGNYCVASSAKEGKKKGFRILFNEAGIGVGNKNKFIKVKEELKNTGVEIINK